MITFLTILFALTAIYGFIAIIVNKAENAKKMPGALPSLVAGVLLFSVFGTITEIGGQDVGVIRTPGGVQKEEVHSGWHIIYPWQHLEIMDKTLWVYTCTSTVKEGQKHDADAIWAPTKDGIKMGFDVSVSWRIIPDEASWIYENVSENDGGNSGRYLWIEENVIRPKLKSAMALTVSNYTPIEAYSGGRQKIQDEVLKKMRDECAGYKLIVEQVDLREVFYNGDFEKAINNKKLAEQEVLRLVEVTRQKTEQLIQARIDKDMAIQQAEGEARALQIKGSSIASNPKIIQLEWINKWNGDLPTHMLGDAKSIMLNLNN